MSDTSTTASARADVHYAWSGPSLLITDHRARCGIQPPTGFYFRETRYLRLLRLLIDGEEPLACSVAEAGPHSLEFSLIHPPVLQPGGGGSGSGASGRHRGLLYRTLDLDLRYHVHPASLDVALKVTNRWNERAEFDLAWELDADYAAVVSAEAQDAGAYARDAGRLEGDMITLSHPRPGLPLITRITVDAPTAWTHAEGRLTTRLALARQEAAEMRLRIEAIDMQDPIDRSEGERREGRRARWQQEVARLQATADTPLIGITNRAMRDLGSMALLEGIEGEWMAPAAGHPLYPGLFGRDALTAAWQAAVLDGGQMIRASLAAVRKLQGSKIDDWRDEEPGRIIQQARRNLPALLGETPFDRYYGDHASPLMFLIGLGQLYAWSGDKRDLEANWSAARAVLAWTRRYGDADGDGYLEYRTRSPKGPKNQGWKDSDNAMVHADGSQAPNPIAACEIQGYWYAALQFMAVLSGFMGDPIAARELWSEATNLKERFNRDFWLDDEGFIALGLDADGRPLRVLTSNAGQCITTGIVADEHLPRLVQRLFQDDLYSGWGLRTLSTRNPAYHPLSYHLGSVWAVENGTILFGLRRYGFDDEATLLAKSLYDLSLIWQGNRIPECIGGYPRTERAHPGAYPHANAPQAWNRSSFAILIQSLLGIRPIAALGLLAIDPQLPPWLPEVTLKGLRVGNARLDLRIWRDADGTSQYEVLDLMGKLHIIRQPPLNSLSAGMWDRLQALIDGALA